MQVPKKILERNSAKQFRYIEYVLYIYIYELRSKLRSWAIGHVQTGWSPIGCEGFEFLEFSLSEVIKVSEAVPL